MEVFKRDISRYISLIAAIVLIAILPGCKHKNIRLPYLQPLTSYIDYQETKQGVTMRAKQLSPENCKSLLGERADRLWKKQRRRHPIFPLQLSITNTTNHLVALKPSDIDLKLTEYQSVASRLHRNSLMQVFGGVAAGLIVTGLLAIGSAFALSASGMLLVILGSVKALAPLAILGCSALIVTPFFLVIGTPIVSTMKGIQTSQYNHMVKKELKERSLAHALVVEPHQTIDTLIFVAKPNYKRKFVITISDPEQAQNHIAFRVRLRN